MSEQTVWIAGRLAVHLDHVDWAILGVFSTEAQAAAACHCLHDFIGPAIIDAPVPEQAQPWPGAYRPLQRLDQTQ